MSNSLSRANGIQSCFTLTTLRKIRRLALTLTSVAVLVVPALAQHRSSTKHRNANHPKQKSVSQAVPRSLPSSAVPQVVATKPSGSRQELDRIERSSVSQAKPAAQQKGHATPVSASHVSSTHERNPAMNFSYQGPRGATKGSRTTNAPRTR
jgi:hypothetical protein